MARQRIARQTQFGYNAIEDKGRRQAPQTRVKPEWQVLTDQKRDKLKATAQDQQRNHAIAAWMIRKHLNYVSQFHFNFRTGKDKVDNLVHRIFQWHAQPRNFDVAGRFGREEGFRLFENEKVINGDAAMVKLGRLLKLQMIESDLIAKGTKAPNGAEPPKNVNSSGLIVDKYGATQKYSICNRGDNGRKKYFDHTEAAKNVIFDAYWTRFGSQFRGVSPLSTAINSIQDISEAFEFNLVKAKMHALFGLAIMRETDGEDGFGGAGGATAETSGSAQAATGTSQDLNPRAVNLLDLNSGDDVKVLESGTPSTEFVEGSYLFIQVALLAFDIPITCFDSRRSSFSARIADLNEYQVSAEPKQKKNRWARQNYSDWLIEQIWNGATEFPLQSVAAGEGMTKRDVQEAVEWIPNGAPWLDKFKQVKGDELAMDLRLDNPIDAARRRGEDVFVNVDKALAVEKYEIEQRAEMELEPAASDAGSVDAALTALVRQTVETTMEENRNETESD
jgi:capsid protein